jgi:hypothetical protein
LKIGSPQVDNEKESKMKKKILWLRTAGFTTAILYTDEFNRRVMLKNDPAKQSESVTDSSGSLANSSNSVGESRKTGSMAKLQNGKPAPSYFEIQSVLDDHGSDQGEALKFLTKIRDIAFDASNEKLAVALGRPTEEIEHVISGNETVDGDVLMKARGLAIQRGLETE